MTGSNASPFILGDQDFTMTWNGFNIVEKDCLARTNPDWECLVIYDPVTGAIFERIDFKTTNRLIELCNTPCWRYKA